jgi:hypothetical protein
LLPTRIEDGEIDQVSRRRPGYAETPRECLHLHALLAHHIQRRQTGLCLDRSDYTDALARPLRDLAASVLHSDRWFLHERP